MPKPLVSIVTPVYNADKYLRESIDSILGQTFGDWEMILVDDKSKDHSREIEEEYAAKDSRIQIIALDQNQGAIRARNTGIKAASGTYYAVQDSDDISLPDRLEAQVSFMKSHPDFAVVGGNSLIMDEHGTVYASRSYPTDPDVIKRTVIRINPFAHSATMVRMDILRKLGGYPVTGYKVADDYCLWLQLLSQYKGTNLPQYVLKYRLFGSEHKNSIRKKLKNTTRAQRPWLFHPEYLSVMGILNYTMENALKLLPQPLVLSLFKLKTYQKYKHH